MTDPTREAFDSDVDLMRDVYMLPSQREAYERILQAALSARAQGGREVAEEVVEAFAHKVFDDANDIYGCGETDAYRDALVMAVRENIALLAALPGKTEVE